MPVILVLRRLRQKDSKFQASLGYTMRPVSKTKTKNPKPLLAIADLPQ
jgi:hypothetical protein